MVTPLSAHQTVDRAKTALQSGAAVGLPELLALLETLSTNYLTVNLDELTELVEKDVTVYAKVISVANTIAHNPGFSPITNITQAIHLVGFQRIRSFTASLMILENTGASRNLPEQREAAAEALCAGLFAAHCAEHMGTVEPDMAFAAATLRYFGLILMPSVSAEHAREARERLKTKPPDVAYRGMFGLTPLELSRRMLLSARLPDEVLRSLREFSPQRPDGNTSTLGMHVTAVAELSSRVAGLALDPNRSSEEFFSKARQCALQFERFVPTPCEFIEPAMVRTADTLQGFLAASGATELPTSSLARIRAHASHCAQPDGLAPAPAPAPAPIPGSEPTAVPKEETTAEPQPLETAVDTATSVPAPAATETVTAGAVDAPSPVTPAVATPAPAAPPVPWEAALEASGAFGTMAAAPTDLSLTQRLAMARDFVQADECWLFRRRLGEESYSIIGGAGTQWEQVRGSAGLRVDERSVFGVALARRQVVLLHDTQDAMVAQYLPPWWQSTKGMPRAIALVPIGKRDEPSGLALLGWRRPQQIAVCRQQLELIREMCTPQADDFSPADAPAPALSAAVQ